MRTALRSSPLAAQDMLQDLCQKFQLDGGLIIHDSLEFHDIIGQTAIYLGLECQPEYNVGLGWGSPLGYVVKEMADNAFKPTPGTVSPLIGRPPVSNEHYAINDMPPVLMSLFRLT